MPSIAEQLAALPVLDDLSRTESPIGAPWAKWPPASEPGDVEAAGYRATIAFATGEEAALRELVEEKLTGGRLGYAIRISARHGIAERLHLLYGAASTTGGGSGYRVRAEETATDVYAIRLERWAAGAEAALLGEATGVSIPVNGGIALSIFDGELTVWKRDSEAAAYTEVLSAEDETFTEGYGGVGEKGNIGRLRDYQAGLLVDPPPPLVPAARVTSEPVDDRLYAKLLHADGSTSRWSGDEPDAHGIPLGIRTTTSAPGGHRDASLTLLRDPRRDWPDLDLVDDVVIYGRTKPLGRNVFEGQTAHFPSELGDGVSIGVKAVGHQVLLNEDETWRQLYVALGFEGWGEAPLWRKEQIANGGYPQGKIPVSTDSGGLVWDVPKEALPAYEHAEQWCEAPAGCKVRKLGYRGKRKGDFSKFEGPVLQATDSETTATGPDVLAPSLTLDDTPRTVELSGARRRLWLRLLSNAEGTPTEATQQSYSRLARYGDHGLTLREIAGELPGVYGHDALAHMLETAAPEIDFTVGGDGTIIPNTSVVIPDLAFLTPSPVTPAIEKLNAYFLNNFAVWDKKRFHWHPWDPDQLTWKASIAGGAHWAPAGRQAFGLLNGLVVSYTDHAGQQRMAGPPGSGCDYEDALLQDTDPSNPYTRRGRRRWGVLQVDFPLAYPTTAVQIGYVRLLEHRMPQRAGTLVIQPSVRGHIPSITHPTMGELPIWAPRAGDFVELVDWSDPEPFRVIETDYDHDSKTLRAQLDTGAARLSAIMERVGARMTGVMGGRL